MNNFADRLSRSITSSKSVLLAGFDPIIDNFPRFFLSSQIHSKLKSDFEVDIYKVLCSYYFNALDVLNNNIAAIKPNIAFFEQYGIEGLRAFRDICFRARELNILVIADIKRGDIGSTAEAYNRAFLGSSAICGRLIEPFFADAVTINPFLGFETVEPFLQSAKELGKGVFVLVKTSNPGSQDIQGLSSSLQTTKHTISERIAEWVAKRGEELVGTCGFSSLGAVVGATDQNQMVALRKLMPNALFLIPGFGAQGASAQDACHGLINASAGVINASRALFGFKNEPIDLDQFRSMLNENLVALNILLNEARFSSCQLSSDQAPA